APASQTHAPVDTEGASAWPSEHPPPVAPRPTLSIDVAHSASAVLVHRHGVPADAVGSGSLAAQQEARITLLLLHALRSRVADDELIPTRETLEGLRVDQRTVPDERRRKWDVEHPDLVDAQRNRHEDRKSVV